MKKIFEQPDDYFVNQQDQIEESKNKTGLNESKIIYENELILENQILDQNIKSLNFQLSNKEKELLQQSQEIEQLKNIVSEKDLKLLNQKQVLGQKQAKLNGSEKEIEIKNIEIRKLQQKLGLVERLNGKLYMDLDRSVSIFN